MDKAFRKTSQGNYFGYRNGFSIFTFKRPHGHWACIIRRRGMYVAAEGYFGTSLRDLNDVKKWVKQWVK
jgi:hypothetical protein